MTETQYKLALNLLIHGNMGITEQGKPCLNFGNEQIVLKNMDAEKNCVRKVVNTFLEVIAGRLQSIAD